MSEFRLRQKRFERLGIITCLSFVGILLGCGFLIKISGAVTSAGYVVQAGENKLVQHPEGGAVAEIFVKNGDLVEVGQPLLVLDAAAVTSQTEMLTKRRFELQMTIARLEALIAGEGAFQYEGEVEFQDVLATQKAIFDSHLARTDSAQAQLSVRMEGLQAELRALEKQKATSSQQLDFLRESIADVQELFDQQLVSKARLTALQRDRVSVLSDLDGLELSIARVRNGYNDARQELNMLGKQDSEALWRELEMAREEINQVSNSLSASSDRESRLIVAAPVSGRVHELEVRNVKAVVAPGDTIMKIVPVSDGPTVQARISPMDVEQVYLGQEVRVRFDTFDMKRTPEIKAEVLSVSPDRITDEQSGEIYFSVSISLPQSQIDLIETGEVIPGLPVTALLTTSERSLLDYLTKPLRAQLFSAFREE